ncbi:AMP-binding protein [Alteromonadaceae bacterium BrNp21-10]|nr:AMP-binding protein [Alteromonadaceae bacterium BrNp21-10]
MFFQQLPQHGHNLALIEGEQRLDYLQLQQQVDAFKQRLPVAGLVLLKASNNIPSMVAYLACLQAQLPMILVDKKINDGYQQTLVDTFKVNALIADGEVQVLSTSAVNIDPQLALLLSTSGSTGSPKQVALSAANLQANAQSICDYLPIESSDVTITTLSPHYSYGLSVINSHLLAGASIVLNEHSVISREFWQTFEQHQVTSFAGVPYTYEMLLRLRFTQKSWPSLRYFTQAGGKLSEDKVSLLAEYAKQHNQQFFVMYGQTEATARMAYNAHPDKKPASIGKAIPKGELSLLDDNGQTIDDCHQQGELVYRGDNIMLGYANNATELRQFTQSDTLATGDIALRDEEGDYIICGRIKRMIKLFGVRISLDEVERILVDKGVEVAVIGNDNALQIVLAQPNDVAAIEQLICQKMQLHPSVVEVKLVAELPRTQNNKIDYLRVAALFLTVEAERLD